MERGQHPQKQPSNGASNKENFGSFLQQKSQKDLRPSQERKAANPYETYTRLMSLMQKDIDHVQLKASEKLNNPAIMREAAPKLSKGGNSASIQKLKQSAGNAVSRDKG